MKDLMLKIGGETYLYHQVTDNDHIISNNQPTLIVINMQVVRYYLAARNSGIKNGTFTSLFLKYGPVYLLYSILLEHILRS